MNEGNVIRIKTWKPGSYWCVPVELFTQFSIGWEVNLKKTISEIYGFLKFSYNLD